jgi:hypothetical protein
MDIRARRLVAVLGAISAVAGANLGAGAAPALASTVLEEKEACKAKLAARRASFAAEQSFFRERFRERQAARREAYVASGPHTREENQRWIRMMNRRKQMWRELMHRRQQRFDERMQTRIEQCNAIGRSSPAASATPLFSSPEEADTQSAAEEAQLESEPLLSP